MAITDGTVICGHCGEWQTTCQLCMGEEKIIDRTADLMRQWKEEREAEHELNAQSAAIFRAANPNL